MRKLYPSTFTRLARFQRQGAQMFYKTSMDKLKKFAEPAPRFENRDACPGCQFLGSHGEFDLWSCVKEDEEGKPGNPTYMARRSDEISDYSSMSQEPGQMWPYPPDHPLSMAKELHAQMRGVEPEPDEAGKSVEVNPDGMDEDASMGNFGTTSPRNYRDVEYGTSSVETALVDILSAAAHAHAIAEESGPPELIQLMEKIEVAAQAIKEMQFGPKWPSEMRD